MSQLQDTLSFTSTPKWSVSVLATTLCWNISWPPSAHRRGCTSVIPSDTGVQTGPLLSSKLHIFTQNPSCSLSFRESSSTSLLRTAQKTNKLPCLSLLLICFCIISSTNTSLIKSSCWWFTDAPFSSRYFSFSSNPNFSLPSSLPALERFILQV